MPVPKSQHIQKHVKKAIQKSEPREDTQDSEEPQQQKEFENADNEMETPPAALENNDGSDQDQEESDS